MVEIIRGSLKWQKAKVRTTKVLLDTIDTIAYNSIYQQAEVIAMEVTHNNMYRYDRNLYAGL